MAIISVYNAPMAGYEYSVYQSTPFIFWIAIIVNLISGISLFVKFYGRDRGMWCTGLLQILLSNIILFSLYVLRGFIYLERSDSQSYIGYAKDVVILGHVPSSNFYPVVSITMASTGELLGQSIVLLSQFMPAIFFTAYTIGLLCWSRTISTQARFITSMLFASMPIFFAWFVPPIFHETMCVLMLPFFFFVLWKSNTGDYRFKLLTAIMIIFFTLGHPLVAVGALAYLTIVMGTEKIMKQERRTFSPTFILFCFVLLFGWISFNVLMVKSIQLIWEQLFGMISGVSTFGSAQGQASQLGIMTALQAVLVCTIDDLIYVLLTIGVGVIILREKWRGNPMTPIMACFLGGGALLALLVLFTFTHNPFRMINLNFVMISTIPLVGYLLYTLKLNGKVVLSRLVTVLILFCMVSTVFTVYQDPVEAFPNGSITRSEIAGSNWLITDRADEMSIYNLQTNTWRYSDLIYGSVYVAQHPEVHDNTRETTSHFDSFLTNDTQGEDYLVITTFDVSIYTKAWKAIDKFNENDFTSLDLLPSIDRIYANGCLNVYSRR